jgi:hypothetical protein
VKLVAPLRSLKKRRIGRFNHELFPAHCAFPCFRYMKALCPSPKLGRKAEKPVIA